MKIVWRILKIIGSILLILALGLGGGLGYLIAAPIPQVTGTLKVSGLISPVEVYRDDWGVPHLYADNAHDLFFAQGYTHAQDRFWQMEFWRRLGAGRLSELFGPATLSFDRFIRTLGWARTAEKEAALLDDQTRGLLQAYADGVNAYLGAHKNLGLEFELLGIQGVKDTPEPWTIVHSLTWVKSMAWDLGENFPNELERTTLVQKTGVEGMEELRPLYASNHPVIVPPEAAYENLDLTALRAEVESLQTVLDSLSPGLGSNSWVIAGSRTDTGRPYLANDPHLGIQMPSIWYEVGLHCNTVSKACPYNVVGFSFAGTPGVVIGHNARIAWGITNLAADAEDMYLEQINPADSDQYQVNGQWQALETIEEKILVHGQMAPPSPEDPNALTGVYDAATGLTTLTLPVHLTRHGPLMDDYAKQVHELSGTFGATQIPEQHAVALRWAGAEPSLTIRAVLNLNAAGNFDEFREALKEFAAPALSVVYADVDGNIGYQAVGQIPMRAAGSGSLPAPGWTDDYEWQGYIPFDKLPFAYNPPAGYVIAANNAAVGADYPYLLTLDWDPGYRAQRIQDMVQAHSAPITEQDVEQMQNDNFNLPATAIVPYLASLHFDDAPTQAALDSLQQWDLRQDRNSGPAALYSVFWVSLLSATFKDELPEPFAWPGPAGVTPVLADPNSHWWDDTTTSNIVEQRDDILRSAFTAAYTTTVKLLGADQTKWAWGKLHTATFHNQTFGYSGIPPIEALFNRGPIPVSGGGDIVNATGWYISQPQADLAYLYQVTSVPSMRMIVDLSDLNKSVAIQTTGQSGHPFHHHYDDMLRLWQRGEYHPQLWERSAVEAAAETHLTLKP